MRKSLVLIILIILVFISVGIYTYFKFFSSSDVPVTLYIEKGIVEVDKGKGWELAVSGMELKNNYAVRTLDGKASIVFYGSDSLQIEERTNVKISDLMPNKINIKQNSGTTFSIIAKLIGIRSYSINTPNTVITVRGTAFGIKVNDQDSVIVGDGIVNVALLDGKSSRNINAMEKLVVKKNKEYQVDSLSDDDIKFMREKISNHIITLKKIRQKEIDKNKWIIKKYKKDLTDKDIEKYIDQADKGYYNLDNLEEKIPVKINSMKKVKRLTEEIIKYNKLLEKNNNDKKTS